MTTKAKTKTKATKASKMREILSQMTVEVRNTPIEAKKQLRASGLKFVDSEYYSARRAVEAQEKLTKLQKPKEFFEQIEGESTTANLISNIAVVKKAIKEIGSLSKLREALEIVEAVVIKN